MRGLDGKVAVVTGAGRGLGKGIATRLAACGARVAVVDIDAESAADCGELLGGPSIAIAADVADGDSVDAMIGEVVDRFGRLDVLVNNAGWDRAGPFLDSDRRDWERVMRVNLYGTLHCSQAALPELIESGGGSLINIASDAGRVGSSGQAVYSASKGGIIAFTKTLARELAPEGVRVNCICPGPANTPLLTEGTAENPRLTEALRRAIPLGRLAEPEDVAAAVEFFASPDSAYITGQTLSVSGGLTMA